MSNLNTALFLDFDHTLFDTDEFFHVDVRGAFGHLGIDDALWEQTYERVWKAGYTLERHAEEIHRQSGNQLPLGEMRSIIDGTFSDLRRYLFSDVLPFLRRAKEKDVYLFLLSFGNPDWQRYKVLASRVGSHFDDMFFVPKEGGKAGIILEVADRFDRIIVVDNNPAELDLIKDMVSTVETYCINRVPDEMFDSRDGSARLRFLEAKKYLGKTWRYQHVVCRDLNGILFL
ncbi:MAG: hypothetical protein HYW90_04575 [Candidatus Sungbacteria bacterium]|nr:hypothetical protein [Candidatus Sungbacteria bacterium]